MALIKQRPATMSQGILDLRGAATAMLMPGTSQKNVEASFHIYFLLMCFILPKPCYSFADIINAFPLLILLNEAGKAMVLRVQPVMLALPTLSILGTNIRHFQFPLILDLSFQIADSFVLCMAN